MIQWVINFIVGIFQMFLLVQFVVLFLKKKEDHRLFQIIIIIISPLPILLVNALQNAWLNLLITILVGCAISILLFIGNLALRIVLPIIGILLIAVFDSIVGTFVLGLITHSGTGISNATVSTVINIIGMLVFFFVILSVRTILNLRKKRGIIIMPSVSYSTLGMLAVTILVAIYIAYVEQNILQDKTFSLMSILCLLALVIMDTIIVVGNENDYQRIMLQNELASMKLQEEQLADLNEAQAAYLNNLAKTTHDFKKHLAVITGLMDEVTVDEAARVKTKTFVADVVNSLELTEHFRFIENSALRVILERTMTKCEETGIAFSSQITYSNFGFMSYKDICTLFMNALDNAIEACIQVKGNVFCKEIFLSINRTERMVLIAVKNSKNNPITIHDNQIQSTKIGDGFHGLGLKNMRRIAQSYQGDIYYQFNDDKFELLATLVADDDK